MKEFKLKIICELEVNGKIHRTQFQNDEIDIKEFEDKYKSFKWEIWNMLRKTGTLDYMF